MLPKYVLVLAALVFLAACASQEQLISTQRTIIAQEGSSIQLAAQQIRWDIGGKTHAMYGYEGMIPGPTFRVQQNSTITVEFTNSLPEETTIHWHGLRQDYRNDGTPGVSQDPVQPGEKFTYTLYFPDEGMFWYHPHVREDRQQDLGLYGTIIVEPQNHAPENREEILVLDDILIEDAEIVPYGKEHANFALMGRFGNTMLVNGKTHYALEAQQGEIVRFFILNAANVRPFNLSLPGARLTRIGGDIGWYENPQQVESIVLGPAERVIVDAYFHTAGKFTLMHTNPWAKYEIVDIAVPPRIPPTTELSLPLQTDVAAYRKHFDRPIDAELILDLEVPHAYMQHLMQQTMGMTGEMHNIMPIEWEDTMLPMNRMMDTQMVKWVMRDNATGAKNDELTYQWEQGSIKKIRLINRKDADHPMQHLMHLHGQRFLVLATDGIPNAHLVWKDTVMVPAGSNVDILVDASNPGIWMFHCHIAEHLEAGMMSSVVVGEGSPHEPPSELMYGQPVEDIWSAACAGAEYAVAGTCEPPRACTSDADCAYLNIDKLPPRVGQCVKEVCEAICGSGILRQCR